MSGRAHIAIIILTLAALVFILRLVRGQRLKAKYSLLWLSVGGLMLLLSIVPGVVDYIARRLGVSYQPALFLLLGLAFLLLVVVHFSYELSRMENRIRGLAEEATFLRHDLEALREERAREEAGRDEDPDKSQGHPLDPHRAPPG